VKDSGDELLYTHFSNEKIKGRATACPAFFIHFVYSYKGTNK